MEETVGGGNGNMLFSNYERNWACGANLRHSVSLRERTFFGWGFEKEDYVHGS